MTKLKTLYAASVLYWSAEWKTHIISEASFREKYLALEWIEQQRFNFGKEDEKFSGRIEIKNFIEIEIDKNDACGSHSIHRINPG